YSMSSADCDTIYIRVENSFYSQCYEIDSFQVCSIANSVPPLPALYACDENNDGSALFDLTQNQDFIFESLNNEDYTVTYYEDLSSAIDGTDQITTPAAYNSNTQEQTIYVRIQSDDDPDCFETASFTIESFPAGVAHN